MSNWNFLNNHRIGSGMFKSDASFGFNGLFGFALPGEARKIRCIASDGAGWEHVSVSFFGSTKTPSWEIMCRVKDLFWDESDWVIQFHPPKDEYVNNHPGCLHLWRSLDSKQPTPPSILVGIK
jgi:hypothetical protein